MSRETKFRAWNNFKKEWVYLPETGDIELVQDYDGIRFDYDKENIILEQWTGLHDKNGKEIYEGDIVKLDSWEGTQQICFIEGAFCLANKAGEFVGDIHYIHHAEHDQATVIGNRHETPEAI